MARLGRRFPVNRWNGQDATRRLIFEAGGFQAAWGRFANSLIKVGAMKKNVAGQKIGAQLISASDGSAFSGSVTVYVTTDAGTQAVGSVGSGACVHEGNGYHTYAPAQAETNGDLLAFTFTGTGAIPQTVQVFTSFPQSVDNATGVADIQSRLPAALVSGRIDSSVGAMAANTLTATAIAADAITAAKLAADVTTELQTGLATSSALAAVAGYLDTEIAAILADTNELQTDWANGGRLDLILDSRASQASVDTVDTVVDAILVDTAEIGAAGAGLTALPWNAAWDAEVQSEVNDGLVAFFTSSAALVDAVWDEAIAGHAGAGSTGEALSAAGAAGDPWTTALPGSYSAGQAGYIIGNNINATVSSRATQTSVDTVDAVVDAILLDTAEIGAAGAGLTALASAANLATVDTVVDAILVDTAEIGVAGAGLTALASAANLATLSGYVDTEVAAIKVVTDALPNAGALTGLQSDLDDIQARLPAALTGGGNMKVDVLAISGSTESADRLERTTLAIVTGTATSGGSTTTIPTSALSPAGTDADQFKGRIVIFDKDTTTAALRGQATDITANTAGATPTLTVTALTAAPAAGDTFTIT